MTSHITAAPWASMLERSTTCTGDGASNGEPRRNEPVTTTSSISPSWAKAGVAFMDKPEITASVSALRELGKVLRIRLLPYFL